MSIIISLTSIKYRFVNKSLMNTLNSLLNLDDQYIIVLNISKEPFLLDKGFTDEDIEILTVMYPSIIINIVKNYGPLRKIIPTLKLFKNNIIITVDDDIIYNKHMIKAFVDAYNEHKCVISSYCRYIDETIVTSCSVVNDCGKYMNIIPQGSGGILYHSSWFKDSFVNFNFTDMEYFIPNVLKNDDLLLRAYTFSKNIPVYKIIYKYIDTTPKIGLFHKYNSKYIINFELFLSTLQHFDL